MLIKPIRLLVVANSIDGGTGTFLLNILTIKELYKTQRIKIKTLVLEKPVFRPLDKFHPDFFVHRKALPNYYNFGKDNILEFYSELLWLREKIELFEPDIVLAIDIRCILLALLCKVLSFGHIRVVASTHIDLKRCLLEKSTPILALILKLVISIFYNYADSLVGVSRELSKNLKKDFNLRKDVITVYNGLERKHIIKKPKLRQRYKIIITVTRLVKQKDNENLIKAFWLLLKVIPNLKLWILGDGPERFKLEDMVKDLDLESSISFLGWVKNTAPYIAKSDLFVLSSKREGMPYSILEAMSQSVPVISTNSPYGPSEILENGKYGLLVPVARPDAMRQAMLQLLTNRKKYNYYSKMSIERSKFFSIDKMLNGYKKIIRKLII